MIAEVGPDVARKIVRQIEAGEWNGPDGKGPEIASKGRRIIFTSGRLTIDGKFQGAEKLYRHILEKADVDRNHC